MFIKILKTVFFFFFLPNGLFFYTCYLNDLFNIDIFNLKRIDILETKIENFKNSIENHSITSKNTDKNESNNILIYIITGCFIVGFFYLGYNFFNNNNSGDVEKLINSTSIEVGKVIIENSAEIGKNINKSSTKTGERIMDNLAKVGKIIMESSSSNSQSLVKEVSGASKMIIESQNKNVQEVLTSILINTRAIENGVISSTEVTRELVATENSFIRELLIKMEGSVINTLKVLNSYINQNVEMKLIHISKKINILENNIGKLLSAYDFSSPEKVRPDISPYFEEEGLDGKISIENVKIESIPVKLDPKKLIFEEK